MTVDIGTGGIMADEERDDADREGGVTDDEDEKLREIEEDQDQNQYGGQDGETDAVEQTKRREDDEE